MPFFLLEAFEGSMFGRYSGFKSWEGENNKEVAMLGSKFIVGLFILIGLKILFGVFSVIVLGVGIFLRGEGRFFDPNVRLTSKKLFLLFLIELGK